MPSHFAFEAIDQGCSSCSSVTSGTLLFSHVFRQPRIPQGTHAVDRDRMHAADALRRMKAALRPKLFTRGRQVRSLKRLASGRAVAHADGEPAEGSSYADSPMSELFRQAGRAIGVQRPRGQVQTLRSFVCAAIHRSKPNRHRGEAFRPSAADWRVDRLVSIGRQCRGRSQRSP